MRIDWSLGIEPHPVAFGDPDAQLFWHPGIKNGASIHYWPNITLLSESEAMLRSKQSLQDALDLAEKHMNLWNTYPI